MSDQQSSAADYRLLALIGKGSFSGAVISMAKHIPSDQTVAVKVIDLETSPLPFSLIQHEIKMHRVFRHKNILPILFSFLHRNEVWTVLPCTPYGSCQDIMHAHFTSGLPETAIAYIVRDVLQGLNYLHSRAVIHRSVKSCHILVYADGTACLSGLRHCFSMLSNGRRLRAVHDFPDHYNNNLNWASRELLEQKLEKDVSFLDDVDIWGIK